MGTQMPLLDADVAPKLVQEQSPGWRGLIVWPGIAALGLAIGLAFLFAPKPTTQTVRRMVQAAEALVRKDPPKPAAEEEHDNKPLTLPKHSPRRGAAPDVPAALAPKPTGQAPVAVHPVTPEGSPLQNAELPLGTARARVRELLGEPDLALYKLERDHVVEHLVYVNRLQNYARSVLLMDGRVVSVDIGIPSVRGVASVSRISN